MSKRTFLQGAVVLGIAGLIIKVLGAVFRIPLANIIGDTGMGYYQTAYPVYVLLLTLSTAGIPVAISRMVAERNAVDNPNAAYQVFRVSFRLLLGIGAVSAAVLFFGAEMIVSHLGKEEAVFAMRAVAPALLVVPMMAAFRGYFQGMQDMKPTAVSQVTEQLFRVAIGLSLAVFFLPKGIEFAAAGASFGATAGAVGGLLAVVFIFMKRHKIIQKSLDPDSKKPVEKSRQILGQILIIAVPITIGAAIMPIMNTIDLGIVINRLSETGFTADEANSLYGQLTGMAGPLINFPQVLTQAISMSLVPAVAAAYKQKDTEFLKHNVELGLRTALLIGLPCGFGLMTLAEPIMLLLYPAQKASALNAAPSLLILAFGVIFLASVQTLTGVLQGIGKQMIPVRNLAIGATAKIVVTYVLTGIPSVNINGAAIGTVTAYVVASILNLLAVRKYTGVRFNLPMTLGKPLFAGLTMSVVVFALYQIGFTVFTSLMESSNLANAISAATAISAGALVYAVMLLVTKAITTEEILLLPKGEKLAKILLRYQK
ncbi:MAG: polysaccharide biosynthesis protein, partial [Eubacteriales bacterium]|nr:polysaccharide biosynthesis protein [Eubacteriales bacterium]